MGMPLIYGVIILFIFLVVGITLFIYSKKKKSKIGLIISSLMLALVALALSANTLDELSISKKDIISDLKHIDIELKDDFEINSNNVTGMPDRIQETEIKISQKDKSRIITKIRNSPNFMNDPQELANETESFSASDKIFNFEYPTSYSRETYIKIDNLMTRLFVSIDKNNNTLTFQKMN
jgi:hypothetical protein